MANQWLEQAKQTMQKLTNNMTGQQNNNQEDIRAIEQAIQSAYNESLNPEEQQELRELENKLNQEYK